MNKIFYKSLFFILLYSVHLVSCQDKINGNINWVSWDNWTAKEILNDRKGLVWIHSPSCDDCIEMGEKVFKHPVIINYINKYYHAIKLDIDFQEDIFTKGKTWKYVNNIGGGGYHQLAASLLGKKQQQSISYPAIVFLDSNFNVIIPISKKLNARELELLLLFIEQDKYKEMSIEQFESNFNYKVEN